MSREFTFLRLLKKQELLNLMSIKFDIWLKRVVLLYLLKTFWIVSSNRISDQPILFIRSSINRNSGNNIRMYSSEECRFCCCGLCCMLEVHIVIWQLSRKLAFRRASWPYKVSVRQQTSLLISNPSHWSWEFLSDTRGQALYSVGFEPDSVRVVQFQFLISQIWSGVEVILCCVRINMPSLIFLPSNSGFPLLGGQSLEFSAISGNASIDRRFQVSRQFNKKNVAKDLVLRLYSR